MATAVAPGVMGQPVSAGSHAAAKEGRTANWHGVAVGSGVGGIAVFVGRGGWVATAVGDAASISAAVGAEVGRTPVVASRQALKPTAADNQINMITSQARLSFNIYHANLPALLSGLCRKIVEFNVSVIDVLIQFACLAHLCYTLAP